MEDRRRRTRPWLSRLFPIFFLANHLQLSAYSVPFCCPVLYFGKCFCDVDVNIFKITQVIGFRFREKKSVTSRQVLTREADEKLEQPMDTEPCSISEASSNLSQEHLVRLYDLSFCTYSHTVYFRIFNE